MPVRNGLVEVSLSCGDHSQSDLCLGNAHWPAFMIVKSGTNPDHFIG
jgi:hypothetical protein